MRSDCGSGLASHRPVECQRALRSPHRRAYASVTCFESLLPLTRQDKLRAALDRLFYKDTILERIQEIGSQRMQRILPRPTLDMSNEAYRDFERPRQRGSVGAGGDRGADRRGNAPQGQPG
jgi:hypothetical protein